jgi:hypothetical protein
MASPDLLPAADAITRAWLWVLSPVRFGAVVLPSFLVAASSATRWCFGLPFTTYADALLAIVAYDATVIVDSHQFRLLFANAALADRIEGIHLSFLVIAAVGWICLVSFAERRLIAAPVEQRRSRESFIASGAGVVIVALLVAFHVLTYLAGASRGPV